MIRGAPAFLRTTTFRLTVLAALLFAASSGLILFYVYGATARALRAQTDRTLRAELASVTEDYPKFGVNGLNRAVSVRSSDAEDFLYVLAYADGRPISGNLNSLPSGFETGDEAVVFEYGRQIADGEVETRRARGVVREFPGGFVLLVGQDVEEDALIVRRIANEAWTAAGLVLLLGAATGAFLSHRFALRVDALNAVARDVMHGDLERRAPRNNTNDELDTLSANLNEMLDRISGLMASMRSAGDSIAHDLRTPLTRMRNRLEASLASDEDREEVLHEVLGEADDLLKTFNAVLRISRLEAGERRGKLVLLDPADVARDLGELYDAVCEDQHIELIVEIADGLQIRGDRAMLSQAFANLLDNAVKYTPADGAIALRVRKTRNGEAEISVTDTGPGIPAEERDRAKQRFVRLEKSRNEPGSGLGLSLVQAVADVHGATFLLEDGPGSTSGEGAGLRAAMVFPKTS
jgi:signal transduction histidine kinase